MLKWWAMGREEKGKGLLVGLMGLSASAFGLPFPHSAYQSVAMKKKEAPAAPLLSKPTGTAQCPLPILVTDVVIGTTTTNIMLLTTCSRKARRLYPAFMSTRRSPVQFGTGRFGGHGRGVSTEGVATGPTGRALRLSRRRAK